MSTDPPTPSKLAQTSGGISKRFAARDVNNRGKHWPAERVHVHIAENYSNRKGNMSSCAYLFSTQTFAGRWRQLPDRDRKALRKMHIHFHSSSGGELPHQTCINDVPVKKKDCLSREWFLSLPRSRRRKVLQQVVLDLEQLETKKTSMYTLLSAIICKVNQHDQGPIARPRRQVAIVHTASMRSDCTIWKKKIPIAMCGRPPESGLNQPECHRLMVFVMHDKQDDHESDFLS